MFRRPEEHYYLLPDHPGTKYDQTQRGYADGTGPLDTAENPKSSIIRQQIYHVFHRDPEATITHSQLLLLMLNTAGKHKADEIEREIKALTDNHVLIMEVDEVEEEPCYSLTSDEEAPPPLPL